MSNNVFNNNHEILSDEENIDPIVVVRNTSSIQNNSSNQVLNSHSSKSATTISSQISMKSTSKTFISMASESDSDYISATPVSSASPAIHHHSREATDSPQGGGLINLDEADLEGDTEAGPDINDDEFKSANEIFKDPSSFDFLSQVLILQPFCFFSATSLLWVEIIHSRFRGHKVSS